MDTKSFDRFRQDHVGRSKGALALVLHLTRLAQKGLPSDADAWTTGSGGQVLGLGKSAVQAILAEHGIVRVLAEEGGRTSRGNIERMKAYLALLTQQALDPEGLREVEDYWIEQIREFFRSKPFRLRFDASKTVSSSLRTLFQDVEAEHDPDPV